MTEAWNIIGKYKEDNPYYLTQHHLDSFKEFVTKSIPSILQSQNPYRIYKGLEKVTIDRQVVEQYRYEIHLYFGGEDGSKIFVSPPAVYDDTGDTNVTRPMYPNEARLRNFTYSFMLSCHVDIVYKIRNGKEVETYKKTLEHVRLGKIPLMLHSHICLLHGQPRSVLQSMGENPYEYGGYFVIRGKEKVIVSQERMTDNNMYLSIRQDPDDHYSHVVEVRSQSEDTSQVSRSNSIRITRKNDDLMVFIPRLRQPVPLFVVFRALGLTTDREIIETIFPDWEAIPSRIKLVLTRACYLAYPVSSQPEALNMLRYLTKGKTLDHVQYHLRFDFLPHLGSDNECKTYYLSVMTRMLLELYLGVRNPTDRDSFHFKRVDLPGVLLSELFRDYYRKFLNSMSLGIDHTYEYNQNIYQNTDFTNVINEANHYKVFNSNIIENGILSGFRGNWGTSRPVPENRVGVVQELQRLSYYGTLSHLRRIHLPLPSSAKIVAPRRLHASQWGVICPVETPDGGNVGKIKTMSISCRVSSGSDPSHAHGILKFLGLQPVTPTSHHSDTQVYLNGKYIGVTDTPEKMVDRFRLYRRTGWVDSYTSIAWKISDRMISVLTDSGRLMRPLLWIDVATQIPEFYRETRDKEIRGNVLLRQSWKSLVMGDAPLLPEKILEDSPEAEKVLSGLSPFDYFRVDSSSKDVEKLEQYLANHTGVIEYLDVEEENTTMISFTNPSREESKGDTEAPKPRYTHREIHPSLVLGVQALIIPFMEHNQFPRNLFSSGQTKQSIGMYTLNYRHRCDLAGSVLYYPQQPLVSSKYVDLINKNTAPYGINAIVAVACYSGYNQEDSIIFNRSSIERGLFRHVYFRTYQVTESLESRFTSETRMLNPIKESATSLSPGHNYDKLDAHGVIQVGQPVDEHTIIVGLGYYDTGDDGQKILVDCSVHPKKGTHGAIHRVFIDSDQGGIRTIKVVVREERIPEIGDKFSSRAAQKGTIGMILPEQDLPYTSMGVRPDMIVNPHCFPSRMTLGQFFEGIFGKSGAVGGFTADATPFTNPTQPGPAIGKILGGYGMEQYGNEIMYNGMTGVQMETEIFMTPIYYMRLKQLVHDKNQSRATGPRNNLTQQATSGRAHGGGLRIGEMERDSILGHGASQFLQESFMVRGDRYHSLVDPQSGLLAPPLKSPGLSKGDNTNDNTNDNDNLNDIQHPNKKTAEDIMTKPSRTVIETPCALKLLFQELQSMSIAPRVVID